MICEPHWDTFYNFDWIHLSMMPFEHSHHPLSLSTLRSDGHSHFCSAYNKCLSRGGRSDVWPNLTKPISISHFCLFLESFSLLGATAKLCAEQRLILRWLKISIHIWAQYAVKSVSHLFLQYHSKSVPLYNYSMMSNVLLFQVIQRTILTVSRDWRH